MRHRPSLNQALGRQGGKLRSGKIDFLVVVTIAIVAMVGAVIMMSRYAGRQGSATVPVTEFEGDL
jgi:hypothetical protein